MSWTRRVFSTLLAERTCSLATRACSCKLQRAQWTQQLAGLPEHSVCAYLRGARFEVWRRFPGTKGGVLSLHKDIFSSQDGHSGHVRGFPEDKRGQGERNQFVDTLQFLFDSGTLRDNPSFQFYQRAKHMRTWFEALKHALCKDTTTSNLMWLMLTENGKPCHALASALTLVQAVSESNSEE